MKGLLAASLIFLTLTIVRVSFPESVSQAKEMLYPVAQYGESLAAELLAIGKKLSGNADAIYVWEKQPPPETQEPDPSPTPTPEHFKLEEMITENLAEYPGGAESLFIPPETEDALAALPERVPEPDREAEAAEAATAAVNALQTQIDEFLARQAAVTDLLLPESISTEAVILDFEYTLPSSAVYTSTFGYRLHPIYGDIRFHYGTDFVAYSGDPISAFTGGTVIAAQEFDGYGLTVIIDHGNGFTSLYAHCSVLNVSFGDTVTMGQTIALVGQTGNVTGPHLHFELQKDGKYLNPEFYL